MKAAVIVFPGSNCDRDLFEAFCSTGFDVVRVWHDDTILPEDIDVIGIPGGFSYGDYLRSGAIAAKSSIIAEVIKFANKGVRVIGICNGFQILIECGLLEGALLKNEKGKFICQNVALKIVSKNNVFTKGYKNKKNVIMPIAHMDGKYYADKKLLRKLKNNDQIAFKYDSGFNLNGSIESIAGILNKNKNVLGLMPHPERVVDDQINEITDGKILFTSLLESVY